MRELVMTRLAKRLMKLILLAAALSTAALTAQGQTLDSGTITLQGTVSGYVEVRAGGPATLSGALGGSISNNKIKGDRLDNPTTLTINFGDVGMSNPNSFVVATVPLRLRSNVLYTLRMSAAAMTYGGGPSDGDSVLLSDIGFGVTSAVRDSGGGVATGTDTIAAAAGGDPTSPANGADNPVTGRYEYNAGHSLVNYTTNSTIVNGPRIMNAMVPTGNNRGLVVTTVFAIKPQIFTPGSFATSVTFTVSSP
ncbi:MAG: hypothetical protein L0229_10345 [Blastocatellia bacterium]|nr:hypothetical protein [Blastocatellia bacterium]